MYQFSGQNIDSYIVTIVLDKTLVKGLISSKSKLQFKW